MSTSAEPSLPLRWRRRPQERKPGLARWLVPLALLGGLGLGGVLVSGHTGRDGFERLLEAGCDEVEPCKALEAEASERLARCAVSCGRERDQQREARHLLYRADERRRVREHYRQSEALEGRIQESERERRIEDEERVLAVQARAEEHLRKEQLAAEHAERERQEARLAEQRARELRYLSLLSPAAREQRLARCHERLATCDALVELLLDAAPDERERRKLVELNERALDTKLGRPLPAPHGAKDAQAGHGEPARAAAAPPAEPTPSPPDGTAAGVNACAGRAEGCCEPGSDADCPGS
jgi:hypothetical protein